MGEGGVLAKNQISEPMEGKEGTQGGGVIPQGKVSVSIQGEWGIYVGR